MGVNKRAVVRRGATIKKIYTELGRRVGGAGRPLQGPLRRARRGPLGSVRCVRSGGEGFPRGVAQRWDTCPYSEVNTWCSEGIDPNKLDQLIFQPPLPRTKVRLYSYWSRRALSPPSGVDLQICCNGDITHRNPNKKYFFLRRMIFFAIMDSLAIYFGFFNGKK